MTVAGRFDGSLMTIALSWRCHPQRLQLWTQVRLDYSSKG